MENKKIITHFERYLNHTTANVASKGDLNCNEKITAQNERYLNHISPKSLAIPSYNHVYRKEEPPKKLPRKMSAT